MEGRRTIDHLYDPVCLQLIYEDRSHFLYKGELNNSFFYLSGSEATKVKSDRHSPRMNKKMKDLSKLNSVSVLFIYFVSFSFSSHPSHASSG